MTIEKLESLIAELFYCFYLFIFAVAVKLPLALITNIGLYMFKEYKNLK